MTLIEAENAIVEEFSMYEEWLDKYEYLIELVKSYAMPSFVILMYS